MPTIKINNADLYYELHGSGHPVVLIAGFACDHLFWLPIFDQLSKHFQLLLIDNRGVGLTIDNEATLSIELCAKDVINLCKELGLERPHIVGQSMGGAIAQTIAAQFPDKVSKVAILTSCAKLRRAVLLAFNSMLQMRKNNIDFDTIFSCMLPWIYGENFLSRQKNIDSLKKAFLDNPNPQSLANQARQCQLLESFDGRAQLSKILAPTLVVHGLQDVVSLVMESQFMVERIPQARLVELDCAHGIVMEVPSELSRVLIEFLS